MRIGSTGKYCYRDGGWLFSYRPQASLYASALRPGSVREPVQRTSSARRHCEHPHLWGSLMQSKDRQALPAAIKKYEAEARRLTGQVSANQRRFLKVGLEKGKQFGPTGWLAGSCT